MDKKNRSSILSFEKKINTLVKNIKVDYLAVSQLYNIVICINNKKIFSVHKSSQLSY